MNMRLFLLLALSCCGGFFLSPFKTVFCAASVTPRYNISHRSIFECTLKNNAHVMEKRYTTIIQRTFTQAPPAPQEGLGCSIAGPKAIKIFYNQPRTPTNPTRNDIYAEVAQYAPLRQEFLSQAFVPQK